MKRGETIHMRSACGVRASKRTCALNVCMLRVVSAFAVPDKPSVRVMVAQCVLCTGVCTWLGRMSFDFSTAFGTSRSL